MIYVILSSNFYHEIMYFLIIFSHERYCLSLLLPRFEKLIGVKIRILEILHAYSCIPYNLGFIIFFINLIIYFKHPTNMSHICGIISSVIILAFIFSYFSCTSINYSVIIFGIIIFKSHYALSWFCYRIR